MEAATAYFNDAVFNRAPMRAASTGLLQFEIPGARGVKAFDPLAESSVDFIGVNYYTRWICVSGGAKERIPMPGAPTTAMPVPQRTFRPHKVARAHQRAIATHQGRGAARSGRKTIPITRVKRTNHTRNRAERISRAPVSRWPGWRDI